MQAHNEDRAGETGQKKFLNRGEIIEAIKELDDGIVHVSLNLIKCDFKATEDDVRAAFPEFNFIKVKNYHAGSFEVVLPLRIDAINFVKQSRDKYILSRKPIIKMGRNFPPSDNQDWVYVGGNSNKHSGHRNYNNRNGGNERRHTGGREHTQEQKAVVGKEGEEKKHEPKQVTKQPEVKPEVKLVLEVKKEQPHEKQPPRQFPETHKPEQPKQKKEYEKKEHVPVVMGLHDDYKPMGFGRNLPAGDGPKTTPPLKIQPKPAVEQKVKPESKPESKPAEVKAVAKQSKPEEKKPAPKNEPKEEVKPQPEKEDDGWHVVEAKRPKKKKN